MQGASRIWELSNDTVPINVRVASKHLRYPMTFLSKPARFLVCRRKWELQLKADGLAVKIRPFSPGFVSSKPWPRY